MVPGVDSWRRYLLAGFGAAGEIVDESAGYGVGQGGWFGDEVGFFLRNVRLVWKGGRGPGRSFGKDCDVSLRFAAASERVLQIMQRILRETTDTFGKVCRVLRRFADSLQGIRARAKERRASRRRPLAPARRHFSGRELRRHARIVEGANGREPVEGAEGPELLEAFPNFPNGYT
jgi:hypothetical protein